MRRARPRSQKLRGGRRYFQRLEGWPDTVRVDVDRDTNCEMWHWHPDVVRGWSLRSGAARRAHLRVLFIAFERLLARTTASDRAAQVFVNVKQHDSPSDAVYYHTPNAAGISFPYRFDRFAFGGQVPDWLAPWVDHPRFEVGAARIDGEWNYVVVPLGRHGRGASPLR
jgi:hypothetical protein